MSVNVYTPADYLIIHETTADFKSRRVQSPIHVVQYDDSLAIAACKLYLNGEEYEVPSGSGVSVDMHVVWQGRNGESVYKEVLGVDASRKIAYFDFDSSMSKYCGEHFPILELSINNKIAGSSPIPFIVDRNPIYNLRH